MAQKLPPQNPPVLPQDAYDFLSKIGLAPVERGMRNMTSTAYDALAALMPEYEARANYERKLQAQKSAENPRSAAAKQGLDAIMEAGKGQGLMGLPAATLMAAMNPQSVLSVAGESLPLSIPAVAGAGALSFAGAPAAVATGTGAALSGVTTGVSDYFESIYSKMAEKGLNALDPADLAKADADPEFQEWKKTNAIPGAIFDGIVGGAIPFSIAGKFFGNMTSKLAATGAEAAVQAGLGGAGEAGKQLLTHGEISSPGDIALEIISEPVTSIPEVAVNVYTDAKSKGKKAQDNVNATTPEIAADIAAIKLETPNAAVAPAGETSVLPTEGSTTKSTLSELPQAGPPSNVEPTVPPPPPADSSGILVKKPEPKPLPDAFAKTDLTTTFAEAPLLEAKPDTQINGTFSAIPVSKLKQIYFPTQNSNKLKIIDQPQLDLRNRAFSYAKMKTFQTPVTLTVEPKINRETDTVESLKVINADGKARVLAINAQNAGQSVPVEFKYATALTPKQAASLAEVPIEVGGRKIKTNVEPYVAQTQEGPRRMAMATEPTPSIVADVQTPVNPSETVTSEGAAGTNNADVFADNTEATVNTEAPTVQGSPVTERAVNRPLSDRFRPSVQRAFPADLDLSTAISKLDEATAAKPSLEATRTSPGIEGLTSQDLVNAVILRTALNVKNNTLSTLDPTQVFATYDFLKDANVLTEEDHKGLDEAVIENGNTTASLSQLNPVDVQVMDPLSAEEWLFDRYLRRPDQRSKFPPATRKAFDKILKAIDDIGAGLKDKAKVKTFDELFVNDDAFIEDEAIQNVFDKRQQIRLQQLNDGILSNYIANDLAELEALGHTGNYDIDDSNADSFTYLTKSTNIAQRIVRNYPGLAERAPIFSRLYNITKGREQDTAKILKYFNTQLRKIVGSSKKDKAAFTEANRHLDRLLSTSQPLRLNNFGQLEYTYNGVRVTVPADQTQKAIDVNNYFKGFLDLFTPVIQQRASKLLNTAPENITLEYLKQQRVKFEDTSDPANVYKLDALDRHIGLMQDIRSLQDPTVPYIPRMRYGNVGIAVHMKDGNGRVDRAREVGMWTIENDITGKVSRKAVAKQKQAIVKQLKDKGHNLDEVNIGNDFLLTYDTIADEMGKDFMAFELLAGLVNSQNAKQYASVADQELNQGQQTLLDNFKEKVFASGLSRHLIQRKNILGYSDNYLRNAQAYTQAMARNVPNMKWAETEANLAAFAKSHTFRAPDGTIQQWVGPMINNHLLYLSSPFGDATALRALNHFWTMGFNVSSAIFQLPTVVTTLPAYISQFDLNVVNTMAEATSTLARVGTTLKTYRPSKIDLSLFDQWEKSGLIKSPEVLKLLQDAWKVGLFQASIGQEFQQDLTDQNALGDKVKSTFAAVSNQSGAMAQTTEAMTRFTTALMLANRITNPNTLRKMVDVYKDNPAFTDLVAVRGEANIPTILMELGMREIHGEYSKAARGFLNRKAWTQLVFPMLTYTQTLFTLLANMAVHRGWAGKRALAVLYGSFFLVGGLQGTPGWDLIEALYKLNAGKPTDLEKDFRENRLDAGWPDWAISMAYNGPFGESVGQRLGIQTPGVAQLMSLLDPETKATQPLGIVGSMIQGGQTALAKSQAGGSPLDVATEVLPAGLRNPLKALNASIEGYSTRKGNRLVNPDDLTTADYLLQTGGLTPEQVTRERKFRYWQTLNKNEGSLKKANTVERVVKLRERLSKTDDAAERERLQDEIGGVKSELRKFNRANNINMDNEYWRGFYRSVNEKRNQRRNPDRLSKELNTRENRKSRDALGLD